MNRPHKSEQKNIVKSLFVYLGSAWVIIEALNFLIDKYYWNSQVLDILILLIIFGLPAMVIYQWSDRRFNKKSIILHALNLIIAISVITFSLIHPNRIDPSQIRLINFHKEQKKLAESVRSLAILPFSNLTETEDQTALIAGLHDALIGEFGRISAIRVMSRTSTLPYANSKKTIKSIASELNVDAILETSVLSVDERVRIQVKLIHAIPEVQLWSQNFDTQLGDIMSLYNEIIRNIASQIQLVLLPEEETSLKQSSLVNPEAYKAYLEGVYQSEKLTERGFELALKSFQRSISLDSMFAPAYAGIAFAWIAALQSRIVSVSEAIPKIYENNQTALMIDDNYPEAHFIKALMSFQGEWDWEKSETSFRRAMALNPNHALTHAQYSHLLLIQKRFDEAFEEIGKALALDPNDPLTLSLFAVILWHHGDLDQATEIYHKLQEMFQGTRIADVQMEGISYLEKDYDTSIELLNSIYRDQIDGFNMVIRAYEEHGYASAMKKLAELLQEQSHIQSLYIALCYNRAGMPEEAISWFERGFEYHDPDMPYAFLPAEASNLRSYPRYQALAQKMNLPL